MCPLMGEDQSERALLTVLHIKGKACRSVLDSASRLPPVPPCVYIYMRRVLILIHRDLDGKKRTSLQDVTVDMGGRQ